MMAQLQLPSYHVVFTALILFRITSIYGERRISIVTNPEPIVVPLGDEVSFDCKMSDPPEKFEWRHLPNWPSSMSNATPLRGKFLKDKRNNSSKFLLTDASNTSVGGYQCIAWYGSQAMASIPALLSIADIHEFPEQKSVVYTVTPRNTVVIQCPLPSSNPPAQLYYFKNNKYLNNSASYNSPAGSYVIQNISSQDSGNYSCEALNYLTTKQVKAKFNFIVKVDTIRHKEAPKFLREPPKNYTVQAYENITLECSAVGTPPPSIRWRRLDENPLPRDRNEHIPTGLRIIHVKPSDQGTYVCKAHNENMPSLTHHVILIVHEKPEVTEGPGDTNATEDDNLMLECSVKGFPEPTVNWLINSHDVLKDKNIEVIGNKIYINSVQKRHAGVVQCFATNPLGTAFSSSFLSVYVKQRFSDTPPSKGRRKSNSKNTTRRKDYDAEMIPPSRPNVTRLSDNSVMVRWNVPDNDGMSIKFFKVQYREFSANDGYDKSSKWRTVSAEIPNGVKTYEVDSLYPNSIYKFRIAAVYANDDNKVGKKSAKFFLKESSFDGKNPLPTPVLKHTEAINETSVRIYWDFPTSENMTIEGFYIYYRLVSTAIEYMKETVDDITARSCSISHLSPGKTYEIKLQCFTASAASDFSAILTQRTHELITESPSTLEIEKGGQTTSVLSTSYLYIIIGSVVIITLLVGVILLLIICKRYRRRKAQNSVPQGEASSSNKSNPVEGGHHIQSESKEYNKGSVPGNINRRMYNGCPAPGPKLTITPNPLAQATDEDK